MKETHTLFSLKTAAATLLGVAAIASAHPAQAQILAGSIDHNTFRPSGRALGMGGTYLLYTDDATAAAFNPANIVNTPKFSLPFAVEGRSSNLNINDVTNLINNIKDIRDEVKKGVGASNVSDVQSQFNKVYDFAANAGAGNAATPNDFSSPATITGSLAPVVGFSAKSKNIAYGLVGFGGISTNFQFTRGGNKDATGGFNGTPFGDPTSAFVTANGGVVGMTNVAVPIGITTKYGSFGISPKYVRADFTAINLSANERNNTVTGAVFNDVNDSKFDIDLGYESPAYTTSNVRVGLAIHNLLSPQFNLPANLSNGSTLPAGATAPSNFNFRQNIAYDLGIGAEPTPGLLLAIEEHNISGVNGASSTFHVGGEYTVKKMLSLRAGYDDSKFVYGLGVKFGGFRLDAAASTDPTQRLSAGVSVVY